MAFYEQPFFQSGYNYGSSGLSNLAYADFLSVERVVLGKYDVKTSDGAKIYQVKLDTSDSDYNGYEVVDNNDQSLMKVYKSVSFCGSCCQDATVESPVGRPIGYLNTKCPVFEIFDENYYEILKIKYKVECCNLDEDSIFKILDSYDNQIGLIEKHSGSAHITFPSNLPVNAKTLILASLFYLKESLTNF